MFMSESENLEELTNNCLKKYSAIVELKIKIHKFLQQKFDEEKEIVSKLKKTAAPLSMINEHLIKKLLILDLGGGLIKNKS
jgi:hypothetical protein